MRQLRHRARDLHKGASWARRRWLGRVKIAGIAAITRWLILEAVP